LGFSNQIILILGSSFMHINFWKKLTSSNNIIREHSGLIIRSVSLWGKSLILFLKRYTVIGTQNANYDDTTIQWIRILDPWYYNFQQISSISSLIFCRNSNCIYELNITIMVVKIIHTFDLFSLSLKFCSWVTSWKIQNLIRDARIHVKTIRSVALDSDTNLWA